MADPAVECGVGPRQGKQCLRVVIPHLAPVVPALLHVARLAPETELATMGVSMAVGAGAAHVGKLQRQVARPAGNSLVAAVQGSSDVTVPEVRFLPDGLPGLLGMALDAVEIQIAVG